VNGCIRVHLASSLNSFSLDWKYCTGPFRTRFSYRKISLFALLDIKLIFGHIPPSLRLGYTEEHRGRYIELGAPDHYREVLVLYLKRPRGKIYRSDVLCAGASDTAT